MVNLGRVSVPYEMVCPKGHRNLIPDVGEGKPVFTNLIGNKCEKCEHVLDAGQCEWHKVMFPIQTEDAPID